MYTGYIQHSENITQETNTIDYWYGHKIHGSTASKHDSCNIKPQLVQYETYKNIGYPRISRKPAGQNTICVDWSRPMEPGKEGTAAGNDRVPNQINI